MPKEKKAVRGGVEIIYSPENTNGSREASYTVRFGNYMTPKVNLVLTKEELQELQECIEQINK